MSDVGVRAPRSADQPPRPVDERFVLPESYQDDEPRRGQGLRDWWWSGTRVQRWAASIGVPLAVVALVGTSVALASGNNEQPIAEADSTTTAERLTGEATSVSPLPTSTPVQLASVTTILTGDTIVVLRDGVDQRVRLIGIDAPEVSGSDAGQQCWGAESRRFASSMLLQEEVQLVPDPTQGDKDTSGATLAYVLLPDGRDFSILSAGAGQARSYTAEAPAAKAAEVDSAEEAARTASLGLWGEPCDGRLAMPGPAPTTTPPPAPTDPVPTTPSPPPTTTTSPPPETDPRFANCAVARARGYGPYVQGVDPEYEWYNDLDADGIVCERDDE